MGKYVQIHDGEWTEVKLRSSLRLCCCDCNLVHKINFRIVPYGTTKNALEMRMVRDNRATAALRRKN